MKIKINTIYFLVLTVVFFVSMKLVLGSILAVSPTQPTNNTWVTTATPSFIFTATSSSLNNFSCELQVDNVSIGKNATTANNTPTTLLANASIAQGEHNWTINCTDDTAGLRSSLFMVHIVSLTK